MRRLDSGVPRRAVLWCLLLTSTIGSVPSADAFGGQVRTGRYRGDLTDPATGEVLMRVAMQVPEKLPAEKQLGLLFLFHGFRGHENNYIGLTVEALRQLQLLDQYVVISGKSKGPGWTTEDDAAVLRVIRWAMETYPIDPRRVFVFGSSNGAAYVGRFGSAHQELIAGVVGYCGNYRFDPALKERPALVRNEWYFVHGGKDNPQNSRRACATLKELGYRYIFRQLDGYGHTDIWDSIGHPDSSKANAVRDDWIWWLHALRHKEIAPSPTEMEALETLEEKLKAAKTGKVNALLAEAERIGGEPAAGVIAAALASSDPSVRVAAAKTTERTFFSNLVITRLIQLLSDESEEVRHAAVQGLTSAANWRNADAQVALCQRAHSVDTPLAERLQAIAALGRVSRLSLLGNFEDGLLIWSLVLLLDDDNPRVRETAFATLGKQVPDTFSYKVDLTRQERSAVMAKWKEWCQGKCGPVPEALR
jgi:pimeloyl-ACP methyl ester carboxylesterase